MERFSPHLRFSVLTIWRFGLMMTLSFLLSATLGVAQQSPILGHSVCGDGAEKVLVFHDWMGDSTNYEPMISCLDPNTFSYVFVDVRGYGRSRHVTGHYTVEEIACDAFRLAEHLNWKRFHVVGHSMNGLTV